MGTRCRPLLLSPRSTTLFWVAGYFLGYIRSWNNEQLRELVAEPGCPDRNFVSFLRPKRGERQFINTDTEMLLFRGIGIESRLRRRGVAQSVAWVVVIVIGSILAGVGCRPSQQTRRNDTRQNTSTSTTNTKFMDSLVRVQSHLVDLIDTMSGVLEKDRSRIRSLELEVSRLKSMLERQQLSAPSSYTAPPRSATGYTPPAYTPPTYTPPTYSPPVSSPLVTPPPSTPTPPGEQLGQPSGQQPPSRAPSQSGSALTDHYAAALQQFNNGQYEDALAAFDELTRTDAQSQYAPNYEYWKGESNYALGRYAQAIESFRTVQQLYPNSVKGDDAAFKIGESYEKMGNRASAKTAYQRLLTSYPESEYRSRVEARLRKL
jgi:tol-pal system protein YbgF